MKGVILAAGCGKRLAPMGWDKPKCLLTFGEMTLLDNIAGALLENGVDRVVAVLGYQRARVAEALAGHPVSCQVVVNDDYANTNTINSLYLAADYLDEAFVYFNADVLFDREIVRQLIAREGTALAVDTAACADEEVKVIVDGDGRIVRIGKQLDPADCLGEFIGVAKFSESVCPALVESLRRYNEDLEQKNLFFESAVDDILGAHPHWAVDIGDLPAIEIDSPEDYQAARELWQKRMARPGGI